MGAERSTRRAFLGSASGLLGAGATVPYWFSGQAAAASPAKSMNDRPHIAAIGVGGRGTGVLQEAAPFGEVVAVCDVDLNHAERAKALFHGKPQIYRDYRKILERKDVDVVLNGTPDHWHTAVNIAACRAGKDVYAEKPLTLTIAEGQRLCQVVRDTGRVVQVGTQDRKSVV